VRREHFKQLMDKWDSLLEKKLTRQEVDSVESNRDLINK